MDATVCHAQYVAFTVEKPESLCTCMLPFSLITINTIQNITNNVFHKSQIANFKAICLIQTCEISIRTIVLLRISYCLTASFDCDIIFYFKIQQVTIH